MKDMTNHNTVFGFIKPLIDVHTMGMLTMANLLMDCGYGVSIADDTVSSALEKIQKLNNYGLVKQWIITNNITFISLSYRLDPQEGCDYFMHLYTRLIDDNMTADKGGPITGFSFAGLPDTCELIRTKTGGRVLLFPGNESPAESLLRYGVPKDKLPKEFREGNAYDKMRWEFAKRIIETEQYKLCGIPDHYGYPSCGKDNDTYLARLDYAKQRHSLPIIRTHSGPYNPDRLEALKEYNSWIVDLAQSRLLDILSIGSSQLTQSHFGEDWEGLANGGGVPINSPIEYQIIRDNARPMLARTYSGTKDVPALAKMHEESLNISWHALSFWWFDELDGRGANTLLQNLREHFEAVRYIATTGKPVEPNVPHHFAFRGADDITYIISAYLAAKACKKMGIKHLILQNMLNTPKYTWGIQDLAKGRAMLRLVKELENDTFSISLQTRAGLDYFAPDLDEAKIQLAAVTCMMDDLEPTNDDSPQIIHVVNYSEAVRLATPPIIKDSIRITLTTLHEYRLARKNGVVPDMRYDKECNERTEALYVEAKEAINILEKTFANLYTPEGFERIFIEGFLPVPYLLDYHRKFPKATHWRTAIKNGGVRVIDDKGNIINTSDRYRKIITSLDI